MSIPEITLRRLGLDDASLYRTMRLEALRCNPEAFNPYEDEAAQELAWFQAKTIRSAIFAAFRGDEALGIAALTTERGRKAHIGTLWTVYVRAEARKFGVGRSLLETIIEYGRNHLEIIQLAVADRNIAARHLYETLGFIQYGFEKHAMKDEHGYHDDILMMKMFKE